MGYVETMKESAPIIISASEKLERIEKEVKNTMSGLIRERERERDIKQKRLRNRMQSVRNQEVRTKYKLEVTLLFT